MKMFRSLRLMLLAFLVCLVPASSYAGVFISVGFAPPVLPVYVQPDCPEAGWMWTPGYWAYGDDGYYWVPGTWVPAPYEGALWTPGYWGFGSGLYVWHPGYWGRHVGYYGGVNYGFGYMGIGFVGGVWAGGGFRYNTAVMRVNTNVIHNTYRDDTIVRNNTIVNDRHVAYSGGPGGINHQPTAQENTYMHESHQGPSSFQTQHESSARTNVNAYASHNGGHPANVAMERPTGVNPHAAIGSQSSGAGGGKMNNGSQGNHGYTPQDHTYNAPHSNTANTPQPHNTPQPQERTYNASHSNAGNTPQPHSTPQPQEHTYNASHSNTGNNPQPHYTPQPQEHQMPQHSGGQPQGGGQPHGGQPQGGGQPHGGPPQGGQGGHEHERGH